MSAKAEAVDSTLSDYLKQKQKSEELISIKFNMPDIEKRIKLFRLLNKFIEKQTKYRPQENELELMVREPQHEYELSNVKVLKMLNYRKSQFQVFEIAPEKLICLSLKDIIWDSDPSAGESASESISTKPLPADKAMAQPSFVEIDKKAIRERNDILDEIESKDEQAIVFIKYDIKKNCRIITQYYCWKCGFGRIK